VCLHFSHGAPSTQGLHYDFFQKKKLTETGTARHERFVNRDGLGPHNPPFRVKIINFSNRIRSIFLGPTKPMPCPALDEHGAGLSPLSLGWVRLILLTSIYNPNTKA
jgi:hypothetical protein